jgi:UDP-glucose 6-dehydrogenase
LPLKKQTKISVIGAGYVGLCTAVGFASQGYNVITSDVAAEKAAKINKVFPPFHEPGLQEKLKDSVQKGNLKCLLTKQKKHKRVPKPVAGTTTLRIIKIFFSPFHHN